LDELEQQQEQYESQNRYSCYSKSDDSTPQFQLDHIQLAKIYQAACRITQKQAYERAYQDSKRARRHQKEGVDPSNSKKKSGKNKFKTIESDIVKNSTIQKLI
jgi:hypothetical protein